MQYLWEAIGMGAYNGYVTGPRFGVVQRDILLDSKMEHVFLLIRGGSGIFSDMLTWDSMLFHPEQVRRHNYLGRNTAVRTIAG